ATPPTRRSMDGCYLLAGRLQTLPPPHDVDPAIRHVAAALSPVSSPRRGRSRTAGLSTFQAVHARRSWTLWAS
ncbi:MAG: hypothetical protein AAF501_14910, partial [Pseudomonadota bacterium]